MAIIAAHDVRQVLTSFNGIRFSHSWHSSNIAGSQRGCLLRLAGKDIEANQEKAGKKETVFHT
jgi:hypothetical protein